MMKIYKGFVKEGWYVGSYERSDDKDAIVIEYVETPNGSVYFSMTSEEAIELAQTIYEVARNYQRGQITGKMFDD